MFFWQKPKENDLLRELNRRRLAADTANNLLFLDFDGVFLSTRNDPKALMANIMALVREFDFHLVISSSWRMHPETAERALKEAGCTAVIDGRTPFESGPRYLEIAHYLMKHPFHQFLILDDLDMGPLRLHAIKTDFFSGFDTKEYKEAKKRFCLLLSEPVKNEDNS